MRATPVPATKTPAIQVPRGQGRSVVWLSSSIRFPFLSLLLQAKNSTRHSTMHRTVVIAPMKYTMALNVFTIKTSREKLPHSGS